MLLYYICKDVPHQMIDQELASELSGIVRDSTNPRRPIHKHHASCAVELADELVSHTIRACMFSIIASTLKLYCFLKNLYQYYNSFEKSRPGIFLI